MFWRVMVMAKHILVVLSNATEGGDAEFNEWYTNTHLGDVLKLRGFTAAQRFRLSDTQLGAEEIPYRYLATYEVETDDVADAAAALRGGVGESGMYISPTLDMGRTVAWFYTPITGRVTATG
jgi:hypothetical protein